MIQNLYSAGARAGVLKSGTAPGRTSVPAIGQVQQTRKDLDEPPGAEQRPYSSTQASKSSFAMSPIEKVKIIFRDDLFPEQAINPGMSLKNSKNTDIIKILENLIELKELMSKYHGVDAPEIDNIRIKLEQVFSDLKHYLDMIRLRYTLTPDVARLEPKERDDAYWEVLLNDKSVLQEHDFSKKIKLATGFEIGDKVGLDSELTEFEIFKTRLKNACSALRNAFSATF